MPEGSTPSEKFAFWSEQRKHSLDDLNQLVEVAKKSSLTKNRPVSERIKWMMLVGKLIWYKDYILRNQEREQIEQKVQELEKYVGIRE